MKTASTLINMPCKHNFILRTMLVATALQVSVPAWASASKQPGAVVAAGSQVDVDKEVKRLFEEGQAAADAGQWEKAAAAFGKAWALEPLPQIAMHLGRAELRSGKTAAGAEHLQLFLREKPNAEAIEVQAVQELLTEAKAKLAVVRIKVDQPGAEVFVNGRLIEAKSLAGPIFLAPGTHTFEAKKTGFASASQRLDLSSGTEVGVSLELAHRGDSQESTGLVPPGGTPARAGFAVTGGLLLAGVGTAIASNQAHDWAIGVRGGTDCIGAAACKQVRDHRASISVGLASMSIGLFAGAVAVGAPTLVYSLSGKKPATATPKPQETSFMVTPTWGGVQVHGRW